MGILRRFREWREDKDGVLTGPDINADSVSTEKATVGIVNGEGDIRRLIERRVPSSDQSSFTFTGLDDDTEYTLFVSSLNVNAATVGLRINGDGSATTNYNYFDKAGTEQAGESEFLVISTSGASGFASSITITRTRYGGTGRPGFEQNLIPPRPSNTDNFGREGGHDVDESLSELTLFTTDSFVGGDTVIELWGRDYQ